MPRTGRASPPRAPRSPLTLALFPLLALLHLCFSLASLAYRLAQALRPPPAARPLAPAPPPRHVGISFALPPERRGRAEDERARAETRDRIVRSLRGAVACAAEWGVEELSVWDAAGFAYAAHADVVRDTLDLPPSPPSSSPSTPPGSPSRPAPVLASAKPAAPTTVTVTARPHTSHGTRLLRIHFLHPSTRDAVATAARALAARTPPLTQPALDAEVRRALGLSTDPDLLLIHAPAPPAGWRACLPRPAPELHGYPPWLLRVTEIYARPPPFPFALAPLADTLRASRLPILRKLGAALPADADWRGHPGAGPGAHSPSASPASRSPVPSPPSRSPSRVATRRDRPGVMGQDTWDGAREAWVKVEQRLGK